MLRQKGLSLIELMIALLLGSLLTIAATQLFLVNRQTENLQLGIAGIQDNGRFAFDFISRSLMEAGMGVDEPIMPFVLDGSELDPDDADAAEIGDGVKYDSIVYRVYTGKDCRGNDFTGYKRFYVKDDSEGKRLFCAAYKFSKEEVDGEMVGTYDGTGLSGTLIDNVESFQVLYGLDFNEPRDAGYGIADIYTDATQLKEMKDSLNKGEIRIVSVRFSVLLASDVRVTLDPDLAPDSIDVLDKSYSQGDGSADTVDFEDGRLYRTYGSTVAIRNLVSGL